MQMLERLRDVYARLDEKALATLDGLPFLLAYFPIQ